MTTDKNKDDPGELAPGTPPGEPGPAENATLKKPPGAPPYAHAQAFCLMRYTCAQCQFSEIFWNSRDGVTPFITSCPRCFGEFIHTDFAADVCSPDHVPEPGQGVWVDMPDSLRRPFAVRRYLRHFSGPEFETDEQAKAKRFADTIAKLMDDWKSNAFLIRWPGRPPVRMEEGKRMLAELTQAPDISERLIDLRIVAELSGFDALILIGQFQLAARHPLNKGTGRDHALAIMRGLQELLTAAVPEVSDLLAAGWSLDFDTIVLDGEETP